MKRWLWLLVLCSAVAVAFADEAAIDTGRTVLDVGCGPGALTGELVGRLGAAAVSAFDPSPPFVEACAGRHPGVDVRLGRAEAIPFDDGRFDAAMAQLVLHFVSDPSKAMHELRRVGQHHRNARGQGDAVITGSGRGARRSGFVFRLHN